MDKDELTSILRTDKTEFRRIRDEDPKAEMDLSGVDLSGCDLRNAALAGVILRNANLRGSDCTNANFRFADLSGTDLRDAEFTGANLHQTTLKDADFEGARLGGVERQTRLCLHVDAFRGVRWSREELETMVQILNENQNWEIQYQIVPKRDR